MGANVQAVTVRFDAVDALTPVMNKMKTGLGQFSTTLKEVRTSSGQVIGTDFTGALTRFNQPLQQINTQAATFTQRLRSIGSGLAQNATSFGVATASIWGVYNAYDNLVKVQIRAESSSNRVRTMTTTLHALEERRRQGLAAGNLTAAEVEILDSRIADTKAKLATAQLRETDLQGDLNEAWANFATTIGPQVVAAGGSIIQLMTNLRGSFAGGGGIINTIKNAFVSLVPGLKAARTEALLLRPPLGNLSTQLPLLGSGAATAGKGMLGLGSSLTGMVGLLGPIAIAVAALTAAWGGYTLGVEKATKFKQEFAVVKTLTNVEDKITQTQKAFDNLKFKPLGQSGDWREILASLSPFTGIINTLIEAEKNATVEGIKLTDQLNNQYNPAVNKSAVATGKNAGLINMIVVALTKYKRGSAEQVQVLGKLQYANQGVYQDSLKAAEALIAENTIIGQIPGVVKPAITVEEQLAAARMKLGQANKFQSIAYVAGLVGRQAGLKLIGAETAATLEGIASTNAHRESLNAFLTTNGVVNDTTNLSIEQMKLLKAAHLGDKEAVDQLSGTMLGLEGGMNNLINAHLKHKIAVEADMKALSSSAGQHRLYLQGVLKGIEAGKQWSEQLLVNIQAEDSERIALQSGAIAMDAYANVMMFSTSKMKELITAQVLMEKGHMKEKIAIAQSTSFLRDNQLIRAQAVTGMHEGITAANDWTISMIKSSQAAESERVQLVALATEMTGLTNISNLTTEQLKALMQTFIQTGDAAGAMASTLAKDLATVTESLNEVFGADTMKDMKEAWKGLDLGGFSDKLQDKLFKIAKPFQEVAERGREAGDQLAVLVKFGDQLGKKDFSTGVKELEKSLAGIKKQKGVEQQIKDFVDSISEMSPQELDANATAIKFLSDALGGDGILDAAERGEFLATFGEKAGGISKPVDSATTSVRNLAKEMSNMGRFNQILSESKQEPPGVNEEHGGRADEEGNIPKGKKATGPFADIIKGVDEAKAKIEELRAAAAQPIELNIDGFIDALAAITTFGITTIKLVATMAKSVVNSISVMAKSSSTLMSAMAQGGSNVINAMVKAVVAVINGMSKAAITSIGAMAKTGVSVTASMAKSMVSSVGQMAASVVSSASKAASSFSSSMSKIVSSANSARSAVNSLKSSIGGLQSKTITITTRFRTVGSPPSSRARGGVEYSANSRTTLWGEAGPEIAAFFPLRNVDQPRKGDYDIVVPSPTLDTSGIQSALGKGLQGRGGGTGPIHVHLTVPVYLTEGLPMIKKFVKDIVLEDVGMFPAA